MGGGKLECKQRQIFFEEWWNCLILLEATLYRNGLEERERERERERF